MHVKLTYNMDGTIDADICAQSMLGGDISKLLDGLRKYSDRVVVERVSPSGAPLHEPEVLK